MNFSNECTFTSYVFGSFMGFYHVRANVRVVMRALPTPTFPIRQTLSFKTLPIPNGLSEVVDL